MGIFDNLGDKVKEGIEKAKKGLNIAADKTKEGANIAKYQVEIKIEENKLHKAQGNLGKHVFNLINNGVNDMSNDATIRTIMEEIRKIEDTILKYKEEMKKSHNKES